MILEMNAYILQSERLGLRKWKDSDLRPFAKMNKDAEVMRYYPRTLTYKESFETVQRIQQHFEKHGFGLFAVEDKLTKQFIGYTGFFIPVFESFFTPCVEIGWRFKKEVWGRGLATEAARVCLNFGFTDLKLDKIVSFTSTLNAKSENVMKRIGMGFVSEFDHPQLEKDSILCRHVLYQICPIDTSSE